MVNNLLCNAGELGLIPWRREWLPTPIFSPGESHGQRSLACYSPWGRKDLDMTEWLIHTRLLSIVGIYKFETPYRLQLVLKPKPIPKR